MRPKEYNIPASDELDKESLKNYVYGAVLDFGPDLHVINHLVGGGIANKIKIKDDVRRFLGREKMDR